MAGASSTSPTGWPAAAARTIAASCRITSPRLGVTALTEALALELARDQILVNAIAPGPIVPPPDITQAEIEEVAGVTPLGPWGGEMEIAKAVLMLCETDFITGETVRGGRRTTPPVRHSVEVSSRAVAYESQSRRGAAPCSISRWCDARVDERRQALDALRQAIEPGIDQLHGITQPIDGLDDAEQHREDDRTQEPGNPQHRLTAASRTRARHTSRPWNDAADGAPGGGD